jgi:hypothetical protein
MSQNIATSSNVEKDSGSPDDGPVRAETGREQIPPEAGSSSTGQGNVAPAPVKKVKHPFTKDDYYTILVTYIKQNANETFRPWNNKAWLEMGPKCLLARHSTESIRNQWTDKFEKEPLWLVHLQDAAKWTATKHFQLLAAKEYKSDPWLMKLHEISDVNIQKISSVVHYVKQTYGRFFPFDRKYFRFSWDTWTLHYIFTKLGVARIDHTVPLGSKMKLLPIKPRTAETETVPKTGDAVPSSLGTDDNDRKKPKSDSILVAPGSGLVVLEKHPDCVATQSAPRASTPLPQLESQARLEDYFSNADADTAKMGQIPKSLFDDHFASASDSLFDFPVDTAIDGNFGTAAKKPEQFPTEIVLSPSDLNPDGFSSLEGFTYEDFFPITERTQHLYYRADIDRHVRSLNQVFIPITISEKQKMSTNKRPTPTQNTGNTNNHCIRPGKKTLFPKKVAYRRCTVFSHDQTYRQARWQQRPQTNGASYPKRLPCSQAGPGAAPRSAPRSAPR